MNSLRKSWAARSISWLLTVALLVPMLMLGRRPAQAQAQQAITVIVADFVNIRTKTTDAVAIQARDAVYNELTASGQGRFNPIPQKELYTEARQLGIRVPSNPNQPANFSRADLTRLAKALSAEGVVKGKVNVASNKAGRVTTVAIDTTIVDAISDKEYPINGAVSKLAVTARAGEAVEEAVTRAIGDTGLDVVRQMVQRQLVTATVLNINVETVIINRGTRDGLRVGDDLLVLEYQPNGSTISKGTIRVARAYATDCECDATLNNGIRPENIARALYRPSVILNIDNLEGNNERSTRINFSTVGKTLAALGLGVLIAVAIKGGQGSLTNATAEATTESNTPAVRVRFADNIFGQGGVLEYKIYRDPDFPFTSPGSGSNNGGGGGTGGGTNGTILPSIPVGISAASNREFLDRPSPNFPFNTGSFLVAQSNGGNNTGGVSSGGNQGGGGGGSTTTGGCGSGTTTLDLGFTPGRTYRYEITAIILRQIVQNDASGSGTGTGGLGGGGAGGSIGTGGGTGNGGGGTGTGGGTGNGNGQSGSSSQCVETDPIRTGIATPVNPVLVTTPINGATNIDLRSFAPSFGSRNGADLFQIEVSTDRTFSNPKLIFRQQVISTAAFQDNVAQNLSTPINLTQAPELLANQTFANFVGSTSTTTPQLPTLYMRIGGRHDEDVPGPVHALSQNAADRDRTFRFVYSQTVTFQPVPLPPANPGSTSKVAGILNRANTGSRAVLPLPGSRRSLTGTHTSSPQEILSGRGRLRN